MAATWGSIEIVSEVSELEKVFAFVDQYCSRCAIPDSIKYKVLLVAEELAMNAMSHGYRGRIDGRIGITLAHTPGEIELRFEDQAPAFDPLRQAPDPDVGAGLAERQIGGFGIHLLKTLSRSADYVRVDDRNVVRVSFADTATAD